MRITVNLEDDKINELLRLTDTSNKNHSIRIAIDDFIRREKMKELASYMGKVEVMGNDEIEALEASEL